MSRAFTNRKSVYLFHLFILFYFVSRNIKEYNNSKEYKKTQFNNEYNKRRKEIIK